MRPSWGVDQRECGPDGWDMRACTEPGRAGRWRTGGGRPAGTRRWRAGRWRAGSGPGRLRSGGALAGLLIGLGLGLVGLPQPAGAAPPAPAWIWPLAGPPAVVRGFDPPVTAYGVGHRGVDLRGAAGAPVRAAGPGRVSYAGLLAGRGVVVVVHGPLRTTYEPITAQVQVGQAVVAGQLLGRLGLGHCAPACLHWGLLRGSTYLDPLLLLGPTRVRLLAVPGGADLAAGSGRGVGGVGAGTALERPTIRLPSTATPATEPRLGLRGQDRSLGAAAAVALLAGLALLIRRPGPKPPSAPVPAAARGVAAAPAPAVLEPAWAGPVDLGTERARRRPG